MKLLPLTQGYSAVVDDEDFARLSEYSWFAIRTVTGGSIHVSAGRWTEGSYPKRKCIRIHYEVLRISPEKGLVVDHINRNPLDNRKSNLRLVNKSENAFNSARSENARGIYYDKGRKRYKAFLTFPEKKYVGTFKTESEAIDALYKAKGHKVVCWAKSEEEAIRLQSEGWEVGQVQMTHHNAWALLLVKSL